MSESVFRLIDTPKTIEEAISNLAKFCAEHDVVRMDEGRYDPVSGIYTVPMWIRKPADRRKEQEKRNGID